MAAARSIHMADSAFAAEDGRGPQRLSSSGVNNRLDGQPTSESYKGHLLADGSKPADAMAGLPSAQTAARVRARVPFVVLRAVLLYAALVCAGLTLARFALRLLPDPIDLAQQVNARPEDVSLMLPTRAPANCLRTTVAMCCFFGTIIASTACWHCNLGRRCDNAAGTPRRAELAV